MSDIDDTTGFSDSDDDLLGLNDNLIGTKSNPNNNPHNLQSASPMISKGNSSGWICQRRSRRNHYTTNNKFTDKSGSKWNKGVEIRKMPNPSTYQLETDQSIPTMEIIDSTSVKLDPKPNRYQRMREIRDITGFIVNIHDAINFDIDLDMPPELHEKYGDVVSNQYTYQDLGNDFLENPDLNRTTQLAPKVGTTYRCRLRGVGMNQLSQQLHTWKTNKMCVEVKQLIDRTDGWVTCTLSDIDVYKRLLVDVVIHTCKENINLRDYLLARMQEEEDPIFYPYSGKKDRSLGSRYY